MTINVTQDEILDALRAAMQPPPGEEGAYTVNELSERLGRSGEAVRTLLKKLLSASAVTVGRGNRTAMDGTNRVVPVYKLIGK